MTSYVGVAPLTIVDTRTESGAVMGVYVYAGRPVPANADPDDVARLVAEGFLAEATDAESDDGGKRKRKGSD